MAIGEFSSRCGLSAKVLRSYADAGVLVPAAVDPVSGYRYYELGQLDQADTVRLLRRAGVSLADIAGFVVAPSADAVDGWEASLTAEALSRRQALGELRCLLGLRPLPSPGATMIEIRPVRDRSELDSLFDLLGSEFPEPLGHGDARSGDLAAHLDDDRPLMVAAHVDGHVAGGALAFRGDNGSVTLRMIAVIEAFRQRGVGRRLVERVETEARRLGARTVALGTDAAVGFWYHLGYTPHLLFQWVYDPELYQAESQAVLAGPLSGLHSWRSTFNDVPQLFVELDEPRLDLRHTVRDVVAGCHVGFMMSKTLETHGAP